jgi:hypothetical protein
MSGVGVKPEEALLRELKHEVVDLAIPVELPFEKFVA